MCRPLRLTKASEGTQTFLRGLREAHDLAAIPVAKEGKMSLPIRNGGEKSHHRRQSFPILGWKRFPNDLPEGPSQEEELQNEQLVLCRPLLANPIRFDLSGDFLEEFVASKDTPCPTFSVPRPAYGGHIEPCHFADEVVVRRGMLGIQHPDEILMLVYRSVQGCVEESPGMLPSRHE
jgi:hypothetical protein